MNYLHLLLGSILKFNQVSLSGELPFCLKKFLKKVRINHWKIVLVTGVFDVLHYEHQNFLRKARLGGDVLIIGIESDSRVKQLKGKTRPFNSQIKRLLNLRRLGTVDEVFVLPNNFFLKARIKQLIRKINPDHLAISSHSSGLFKKKKIMKECGSDLKVVHDRNFKISTTLILENKADPSEAICYDTNLQKV
jgi:D-beta-D-heptose 7-phosphate kinase/D-beta-D-heptose 1-phosphate adenosyltransferase